MSTAPIAFTGVSTYSSDLQSILSRQQQIAQIPIRQLQNKQSDNASKIQLLGSLNTAAAALGSAIGALGAIGGSKGLVAVSSSAAVSVLNTGATDAGTYTISNVTSLASAASETSVNGFPDDSAGAVPSSLQLVLGSNTYNITLASGKNNLAGLRDAINASGAAVTASILTAGTGANANYLSVSADDSGATTLQLNDMTNPRSPVAFLNHAQPISENSVQTYADAAATPVSSNRTLELVLGSTTYQVTLGPGENNLNGLAAELNNIAGTPVHAAVSTAGGSSSLVVTASRIGAAAMQLNDVAASGVKTNLLNGINNNANQGSNAVFSLNGIPVSKTTNHINTVIPGLTFDLNSQPTGPVTLSLSSDRTSLSGALSDLASKYNAVVDQIDSQRGPNAGLLSGDLAILSVEDDMRQLTTYSSRQNMSLAALGINFDNTGKMSFDQTAVNGLSDSQLADAFRYLGSTNTGFGSIAKQFSQLTDPATGVLHSERTGLSTANTHLGDQITALTDRITAAQNSLTLRLEKADAALAALQSQQQVLTASVQSVNLALYGKNFGSSS